MSDAQLQEIEKIEQMEADINIWAEVKETKYKFRLLLAQLFPFLFDNYNNPSELVDILAWCRQQNNQNYKKEQIV